MNLEKIVEILKNNKIIDGRTKLTGQYDEKIRNAVAKYQKKLKEEGYYKKEENGIFGTYTEIAHNKSIKANKDNKAQKNTVEKELENEE